MPAYEIHVETYTVEEFPVIEAADPYEAAIQYAGRFAPVKLRRIRPEVDGDVFLIQPTDAQGDERGVEVEVFEHDPDLR